MPRSKLPEDPTLTLESAKVRRSEKDPQNLELEFPGKPPAEIRARLREAGLKWDWDLKVWYGSPDQVAELGLSE